MLLIFGIVSEIIMSLNVLAYLLVLIPRIGLLVFDMFLTYKYLVKALTIPVKYKTKYLPSSGKHIFTKLYNQKLMQDEADNEQGGG